jgi:AGZA family xanthine/uracil permease-like MFS transporter
VNLDRIFRLQAHGTDVRTELIAGITTFLTMAYILVVNPSILADAGMDRAGVLAATALGAALGTLVMAFLANLPFALAPGMGLNAFFAYTVCVGMGYPWQLALTAVFVEGLLFLALTFLRLREAIIHAIPDHLKRAIAAGIGLFIAGIGLRNGGLLAAGDGGSAQLGDLLGAGPLVAVVGLLLAAVLEARKVRGSLLWGILGATLIGVPLGVTELPAGWSGVPSPAPVFLKFQWHQVLTPDFLVVLFTFLFVDLFDTAGTLIGVATRSGMLDADGRLPRAREALLADAIGTTAGACLGTSTVTVYVESAAGTAQGGRTGLTALTVAVLFVVSLLLAPLFLAIPGEATAGALILVGLLMLQPVREIALDDPADAVPSFLTLIVMPLAGSIADGILVGMLAHVVLRVLLGRAREVTAVAWIIAAVFVTKLLV